MKKLLLTLCLINIIFAEQNLVEIINKYYEQLNQHAKRSAKISSLTEAYEKFSRLPALQDFLTYEGVNSTSLEIANSRKITNKQMGFFYPAKMYDNHRELIYAINPLRRSQVKAKLTNVRSGLSREIASKNIQQKALNTLDKTIAKLSKTKRKAESRLQQVEEAIEALEDRVSDARSDIDSRRSSVGGSADEELRLIAIIRRLDGQIVREVNDATRISLINRRNSFERQRRGIIAERDQFVRDVRRLERQIASDLRQLDSLKRERPRLERKAQEASPELGSLEDKREEIKNNINEIEEKLAPLKKLENEEQQISQVIKEYQEWWRRAKHRPKYHFLLALYAIDKLPKENIQIRIKKNFALGGIVEVYFR
ncbi:hypothetical protein [Candidatus Uabimicrobium amorphum]|uniref:Chromosome partition protein Smc n=1 Tax=Uabimicrobium amorphum TaxID=2596890 RepID=A0A5S9IJT8_UABAM|nr:hypothetical protein [Candidatus Uabimicrobium amorphum]BBM83024.1 chromosome partition protein Smc [Candidatus Uabimicrobium amorphum]